MRQKGQILSKFIEKFVIRELFSFGTAEFVRYSRIFVIREFVISGFFYVQSIVIWPGPAEQFVIGENSLYPDSL